jgi:hypothetical protein
MIIVIAVSTHYVGDYISSQMTLNSQPMSQPYTVKPAEIVPSPALVVPTPPATVKPTPTPQPTPNGSPVTVTPSPSSTSPPSTLQLGIYRSFPTQVSQQVLDNIDWSTIVPGQARNSSTIYFRNEGTVPLTMTFSPSNWVFHDAAGNALPQSYSQYFTLTWDYDNSSVKVNEVRPLVFTLAVSSNLTDVASFSFNLVVTMTSAM